MITGFFGYAMSRYAGVWVGVKLVKETVESTASIEASIDRARPVTPADFVMPPGGLNIRARDPVLEQERRLHNFKRDAVLAWVRANRLNRIITSGGTNAKNWRDRRGQILSRRAPGDGRTRPRRSRRQCAWPAHPQDRLRLAARAHRLEAIRARTRSHHRRRGEAFADRGAVARRTLRIAKPADADR
ncbi:protein of unknown function [Methylocella tundrae]|uniref:Uncharacterized protein n=1 Tax=Methylocella tundrae TaxID=227605 RepID=A0A4V6IMC0_METTU|nr:protein of unknown function [Methylocella tundrae]